MTVLGPVAADDVGTTLTHEHLLFDQIEYVRGAVDAEAARYDDAKVEIRHLGALRRRPALIPDNGRNYDPELASREMELFKEAGGDTVVEVSSRGLGRDALGTEADSRIVGREHHRGLRVLQGGRAFARYGRAERRGRDGGDCTRAGNRASATPAFAQG